MSTISVSFDKAARYASPQKSSKLQDLVYGLKDNVEHHRKAADKVNDPIVSAVFTDLANEREAILKSIGGVMNSVAKTPDESSSLLGKLKTCWISFRASLNGGDETVVLIEAERAEDALLSQFRTLLSEFAGNPLTVDLFESFDKVKAGHDQITGMRSR